LGIQIFSDSNKQAKASAWETLCKTFIENCFSFYKFCYATKEAPELPPVRPSHMVTDGGGNGSSEQQRHWCKLLLRLLAALLTTTCGKAA